MGFRDDVTEVIDESWFTVLPSEREGHPVATIEAAARGRASLLTDVDGSRDCVPPGVALVNGVPPHNPDALADALETWLTNPPLVQADGRRFYGFHRQHFDVPNIGARYAALYTRVAGSRAPAIGRGNASVFR
jgi:glycosyltransferase involved in cell wall biosynthesis